MTHLRVIANLKAVTEPRACVLTQLAEGGWRQLATRGTSEVSSRSESNLGASSPTVFRKYISRTYGKPDAVDKAQKSIVFSRQEGWITK
jgi:hypothetical protein